MKKNLLILFLIAPFYGHAQPDGYFADFCVAYDKFISSHDVYCAFSSEAATDTVFYGFSGIAQQYHTLLKIYDEASFKYRRDEVFDKISRPYYLDILNEVELLLEFDLSLRSLKDVIRTMVSIEREGFPHRDHKVEEYIRLLHLSDSYHPDFFAHTIEGMLLKKQLNALEAYIFRKYFDRTGKQLSLAPVTDSTRIQAGNFRKLMEASSCTPCRNSASKVLLDFHRRAKR